MINLKEQYKEFEIDRFIYGFSNVAPVAATQNEADEKPKKETKDKKEAKKDPIDKIINKQKENIIGKDKMSLVGKMLTNAKKHAESIYKNDTDKQKAYIKTANTFAKKVTIEVNNRFKDLSQEYKDRTTNVSEAFIQVKGKIDNFSTKIKGRLKAEGKEGYKTTIEEQMYIDQMKASEEFSGSADIKKHREAKAYFIEQYLLAKYPEMKDNQGVANLLANIIAEDNNILIPDYADINEHNGSDLLNILEDRNDIQTALGSALKETYINDTLDENDKVVKKGLLSRFLDKIPSPEATDIEKAEIDNILIGLNQEPPFNEDLMTALAMRFDMRVDEETGMPKYFIDLTGGTNEEGKNKVYTPEQMKDVISKFLHTNTDPVQYKEKMENELEQLKNQRITIEQGYGATKNKAGQFFKGLISFGIWPGVEAATGDIEDFNDWAESDEVKDMMTNFNEIQDNANSIENNIETEKNKEKTNKQIDKRFKTLDSAITDAGLGKDSETSKALKSKGYNVEDSYPNKNLLKEGKETLTATLTYTEAGKPTVTIKVDCTDATPVINLKIDKGEADYPVDSIERALTPKEFKTDYEGDKLVGLIEKPKENIKNHKEKIEKINNDLTAKNKELKKGVNKKNRLVLTPEIELSKINESDLTEDTFTYSINIKNKDLVLGNITMELNTNKEQNLSNIMVTIPTVDKPIAFKDIPKTLKGKLKEIKDLAELNKTNRAKIIKQLTKDNIKKEDAVEELEIKLVKTTFPTDFADPKKKISIANVNKNDKKIATIYIVVGKPSEAKAYIVTPEDGSGDVQCKDIGAVHTYLKTNKDKLEPKKEEKKGEEVPKNATTLNEIGREKAEKARDNLVKMMVNTWPAIAPQALKNGVKDGDITKALESYPKLGSAINKFLKDIGEDRYKELVEGKSLNATKAEKQFASAAFKEAYGIGSLEATSEEITLINEFTIAIGEENFKIKDIFPENFISILAMRNEIKEEKGVIKIKDGDKFIPLTQANLKKFLPDTIRKNYEKIINQKDSKKRQELLRTLSKDVDAEKKMLDQFKEVQDLLANAQDLDAFKNMSFFEFISALGQLWSAISEAMASKDFATLAEVIQDLQTGKNPAEEMVNSERAYKKVIDKEEDMGNLLSIYTDPRGEVATKVLGEGRYKSRAKNAVKGRFEKTLGIKGVTMETFAGGDVVVIKGSRGSQQYEFVIERSEGGPITVSRFPMTKDPENDDKLVRNTQDAGFTDIEIKTLSKGADSLASVSLSKKIAPPKETTETTDENPIAEGTIKEEAPINNNYVLTKAVNEKTIHDVLDYATTKEAVIIIGDNNTFLKAGSKVTVIPGKESGKDGKKNPETFVIKEGNKEGKRLRVYKGDKIESTTKKV